MKIIIALLIFTIVVVVHEFGHFIAARIFGIQVDEFAIGMGPKLLGYKPKKSQTLFSIRILPLGGSCRMLGEDEGDMSPHSFNAKPTWQRMIVLFAGVFMNAVLALVLAIFLSVMSPIGVPVISQFSEGSAAEAAGMEAGDRIVSIGKKKIHLFQDISFYMMDSKGETEEIVVKRGTETLSFQITPVLAEDGYKIGIYPSVLNGMLSKEAEGFERATFGESIEHGARYAVFTVRVTLDGFSKLVTGRINADDMSGPVGIVNIVGDSYEEALTQEGGGPLAAFLTMINMTVFLSANLVVVNLLPIPALDVGRLVFLFIELIRRKPIDPNKEGVIHFIGFALLMVFALFITYKDIMRIFVK